MKFADSIGIVGINKALGLQYKHILKEDAIQKCVVDIDLSHIPISSHSNRENYFDGGRFHNEDERFGEINARGLMKPLATRRAL